MPAKLADDVRADVAGDSWQIGRAGLGHLRGPLPYPMRLGRYPVAIAMMASTVAT
jgi:hypothetical protein